MFNKEDMANSYRMGAGEGFVLGLMAGVLVGVFL